MNAPKPISLTRDEVKTEDGFSRAPNPPEKTPGHSLTLPDDKNGGLLSYREVWRILQIYKFFIGTVTLGTVALTALYTFFSPPDYRTSVVISVVTSNSYKSLTDITGYLRGDEMVVNKLSALVEYFKSQDLAEQVLESVATPENNIPILKQTGPRRFLTFVGLAKPLTVGEALDTRPRAMVAADVMANLAATPNIVNGTLVIESTTTDPEMAAFLANETAHVILQINHKSSFKMVEEVKGFLHNQASELGSKLKSLESELTNFESQNHIISIDEAQSRVFSNIDRNDQELSNVELRLAANNRLIDQIKDEKQKLKDSLTSSNQGVSHLYLAQMQHRLSMLQYQAAMADSKSSEAVKLNQEIESISKAYRTALESHDSTSEMGSVTPLQYFNSLEQALGQLLKDNKNLRSNRDSLMAVLKTRKSEIPRLALSGQQLNDLRRNISLTSDLYLAIRKKIQETEIQEAGTINDVSILSEAPVPEAPHSVSIFLKLSFAGAIALFGSILLILGREGAIPTVRNRHDLERKGLLILGEIPGVTSIPRPKNKQGIVLLRDCPVSYESDVYRSVRMRLVAYEKDLFNNQKKTQATIILMTSPRGGNGKTFTAVNTAMALSKGQHKTLLIDMDLRRPSVGNYFMDQNRTGVIDNLTAACDDASIDYNQLNTMTTVTPYLDVAFGNGSVQNPTDILDSTVASNYFLAQKQNYDYIVIDSPPLLGVIDSVMIAPLADIIVFITEHRRTHREDVNVAVDILKEVYTRPMLAIINFVHRELTYYDTVKYYHRKDKPAETA